MTAVDMARVRRAAALLRRRWPLIDADDALSCAGEAAAQVGTDDEARLVAVARLRAIDHHRRMVAVSRRDPTARFEIGRAHV